MELANELGLDLTPNGLAEMSRLDALSEMVIEVGYQSNQSAGDGETSMAEVAYWNHYGTVHKDGSVMIPARPFMDELEKHKEDLSNWAANAPITVEGGWMMNEYGRNGPVPVHVKGKGSSKPLIDTGALRQNCQFVVKKGGSK